MEHRVDAKLPRTSTAMKAIIPAHPASCSRLHWARRNIGTSVQPLNFGCHVRNEPHPVRGVVALENPGGLIRL